MAPRARARGATAGPSSTASTATTSLPHYEAPKHSLTPAGQNAMIALKRTHELRSLQSHLKDSNTMLAEIGFESQELYRYRLESLEKRKKAAENRGAEVDFDDEDNDLEAFGAKVDNLTSRMEKQVRENIDGQQMVKDMEFALQFAQQNAAGGQGRAQRTQPQSFDPTMPGATEDSEAEEAVQLGPSPSAVFTDQLETRKEQYTTLSHSTRYAEHNEYVGFKSGVHSGRFGDEAPLPPASKWFRDGRGSPMPGTAAGAEEDESDDDDIAIARESISTKCPLTLREFVDPVTSTICPHSFERSAIHEMLGRGGSIQCPVPGCTSNLTRQTLEANSILIHKIRRIQKSRRAAQDDADSDMEDAPPGQDARRGINIVSSPGAGDGFDASFMDEDEAVPSTLPKNEPTSSRLSRPPQSQPPPSSRAVVVELSGGEDTEDEDE